MPPIQVPGLPVALGAKELVTVVSCLVLVGWILAIRFTIGRERREFDRLGGQISKLESSSQADPKPFETSYLTSLRVQSGPGENIYGILLDALRAHSAASETVGVLEARVRDRCDLVRARAGVPVYAGLALTLLGLILAVWSYDRSDAAAVESLVRGFAPSFLASFIGVCGTLWLSFYVVPALELEASNLVGRFQRLVHLQDAAGSPLDRDAERIALAISKVLAKDREHWMSATETLKEASGTLAGVAAALSSAADSSRGAFEELKAAAEPIGSLADSAPLLAESISRLGEAAEAAKPTAQAAKVMIKALENQIEILSRQEDVAVRLAEAASNLLRQMETLPQASQGSIDRLAARLRDEVAAILTRMEASDQAREAAMQSIRTLLEQNREVMSRTFELASEKMLVGMEARATEEARRQYDVLREALQALAEASSSGNSPVGPGGMDTERVLVELRRLGEQLDLARNVPGSQALDYMRIREEVRLAVRESLGRGGARKTSKGIADWYERLWGRNKK